MNMEQENKIDQIEPPKVSKKLPARIWVSYIIMTAAIAGFVTLAVAFMLGYRLTLNGEIERTGIVQVISSPTGATISVNGNVLGVRTNDKLVLTEGEHWIEVKRNGFYTWQGRYDVKMDNVLWLDYILLFPNQLKPKVAADFKLTPVSVMGYNQILAEDANKALYTVNFNRNEYRTTKLPFTWAELQKLIGDEITLQQILMTDNDNTFWLLGNNNQIFTYSASDKKVTQIGADKKITSIAIFERDLIFAARKVSSEDVSKEQFEVYSYRAGDATATYWKTLDSAPTLAISMYENTPYFAVSWGEKTELYKSTGRAHENSQFVLALEGSGNLSFSPEGRFLHVADQNYDIENNQIHSGITAKHWFNYHLMSSVEDDKFLVQDFDGQNLRSIDITPSSLDYVFVSENNRNLYFFDKNNNLILINLESE